MTDCPACGALNYVALRGIEQHTLLCWRCGEYFALKPDGTSWRHQPTRRETGEKVLGLLIGV